MGIFFALSDAEKYFDRKAIMHDVWDFALHENYNDNVAFANDVALIIIHDSFKFGTKVQRAILTNNVEWMDEKEKHFIVTGWGADGVRFIRLRFIFYFYFWLLCVLAYIFVFI